MKGGTYEWISPLRDSVPFCFFGIATLICAIIPVILPFCVMILKLGIESKGSASSSLYVYVNVLVLKSLPDVWFESPLVCGSPRSPSPPPSAPLNAAGLRCAALCCAVLRCGYVGAVRCPSALSRISLGGGATPDGQ